MSILFIIIFILSLALNVLLVWYVRKVQVDYILYLRDNLEEFAYMHTQFSEHIEEVYNMEMFYGDQSLSKLLEHSKFVSEQTQQYLDVLRGLDFEEDEEE
tara:strand:- start:3044 stop:3343 length:300 start_codon:yes stop_codon:yes gene_type:complete